MSCASSPGDLQLELPADPPPPALSTRDPQLELPADPPPPALSTRDPQLELPVDPLQPDQLELLIHQRKARQRERTALAFQTIPISLQNTSINNSSLLAYLNTEQPHQLSVPNIEDSMPLKNIPVETSLDFNNNCSTSEPLKNTQDAPEIPVTNNNNLVSSAHSNREKFDYLALMSVIKHVDKKKKSGSKKKGFQDIAREKLATMEIKKKGQSYGHLLVKYPSNPSENNVLYRYNPDDIDNPLLDSGLVQRTMLGLPGMIGSIFQFSNNPSIKSELNERFAEQHYELNQIGLSITKIRKTKAVLAMTSRQINLQQSSLALSYVYYEKLLLLFAEYLKNKNPDFVGLNIQEISRINGSIASTFNIFASISLLLAAKINEPYPTKIVSLLTSQLAKNFIINKKLIYEYEFFVFSALEFDLTPSKKQFLPHLNRLLSL
ncbi:hypothetical protein BB561_002537 [Smittium simulii]|uniref:Cyclin N-terminal domain-containing protein n=1 Tax=Smittium simulii TaxID=133385 RepID=A0A2T9YQ01_9FUNG|nr:hypothetical protein BB561_002537 [Smittium simulii]